MEELCVCENEVGCVQSVQIELKGLLGQEQHSLCVRIQSFLPNLVLLASDILKWEIVQTLKYC